MAISFLASFGSRHAWWWFVFVQVHYVALKGHFTHELEDLWPMHSQYLISKKGRDYPSPLHTRRWRLKGQSDCHARKVYMDSYMANYVLPWIWVSCSTIIYVNPPPQEVGLTNVRGEPEFSVMVAGWFCEKSGWFGKVEDVPVLSKTKRISTSNHFEEEDFYLDELWNKRFPPVWFIWGRISTGSRI